MEDKIWNEFVISADRVKEADRSANVATALGEAIIMFLNQDNVCKVYDDEYGIYVIQYEHDDEHRDQWWGGSKLLWVTDEEYEDIISRRMVQEDPQDEYYESEEDSDSENEKVKVYR